MHLCVIWLLISQGWCNWTQPKKTARFRNKITSKTTKPTLYFCFQESTMNYEVRSKISSTIVQVTENFSFWSNKMNSNEIWRTWKNQKNIWTVLSKCHWQSSSALQNQNIFTNVSAFSASKLFLMLDHTKSYVEKIHSRSVLFNLFVIMEPLIYFRVCYGTPSTKI